MGWLTGLPLKAYLYAGIIALMLILVLAVKVQSNRLASVKAEYAMFQATTKALGHQAELHAKMVEEQDKRNKEKADAENSRTRSTIASLTHSLRDSRSDRSYLPPAASGSASPSSATFDRAILDGAIQRLDAGVQILIDEGDQARIDLDSAKRWANP